MCELTCVPVSCDDPEIFSERPACCGRGSSNDGLLSCRCVSAREERGGRRARNRKPGDRRPSAGGEAGSPAVM